MRPLMAALLPALLWSVASLGQSTQPAADLGPTLITLHIKNGSAKDAFAALFRQADESLPLSPANLLDDPGKKVTVDYDRRPFWEVLEGMCKQAGVGLTDTDGPLRLTKRDTLPDGPRVIAGPCMVIAIVAEYERDIPISTNVGRVPLRNLHLETEVILEPKFKGKVLSAAPPTILEATDDRGNSLIPTGRNDSIIVKDPFSSALSTIFALNMPARNIGSRLVRFRARADLRIASAMQHIDVPDILTSPLVVGNMDGVHLGITGMKKRDDGYAVEINIDPDLAGRWHEVEDQAAKGLRLLDADGHDLPRGKLEISGTNIGDETIDVVFPTAANACPPAKLVWDIPSATRVLQVPIEFKDLDLNMIR